MFQTSKGTQEHSGGGKGDFVQWDQGTAPRCPQALLQVFLHAHGLAKPSLVKAAVSRSNFVLSFECHSFHVSGLCC